VVVQLLLFRMEPFNRWFFDEWQFCMAHKSATSISSSLKMYYSKWLWPFCCLYLYSLSYDGHLICMCLFDGLEDCSLHMSECSFLWSSKAVVAVYEHVEARSFFWWQMIASLTVFIHLPTLLPCKIWGFHGRDYEEWCLLGCYAVWLL
jgi:hypothetical protein